MYSAAWCNTVMMDMVMVQHSDDGHGDGAAQCTMTIVQHSDA